MIIVFGSVNIDLVTEVDTLPQVGETKLGMHYEKHPGGKGANQALAAKRAGSEVSMIGAVGEDSFAQPALAQLEKAGVDISNVRAVEMPTGVAFISRGLVKKGEPKKDNLIVVAQGANLLVSAEGIARLPLDKRCGLLLQREVPDEENEAAARLARARSVRTILNFAPSGRLSDDLFRADGLCSLIDIMVVNEHEAADLAAALGLADDHAGLAAHLSERFGIGATVVTLGADGAVGWERGVEHRAPCPKVEAVDTTAAGDSFVGFFAAALDAGLPFAEAMRRGIAAGSLACTAAGAQPSIPRAAAVDALLGQG